MTGTRKSIVAIYPTHAEAEQAVKDLGHGDFDLRNLSIVGRDEHTDEHVVGFYSAGDRMKYWGKLGAFWGGIWGLLFGSAALLIPGFGPLVVAGPLASSIVGVLEGSLVGGGVGILGSGLYSFGLPRNSVLQYETALKVGKFLVIAHGPESEVEHARDILRESKPETLAEHEFSHSSGDV